MVDTDKLCDSMKQYLDSITKKYNITCYDDFTCPFHKEIAVTMGYFEKDEDNMNSPKPYPLDEFNQLERALETAHTDLAWLYCHIEEGILIEQNNEWTTKILLKYIDGVLDNISDGFKAGHALHEYYKEV